MGMSCCRCNCCWTCPLGAVYCHWPCCWAPAGPKPTPVSCRLIPFPVTNLGVESQSPSGFSSRQLTQKRVTEQDPGCALESVKRWGFEGQGPACHLLYWDTVVSKLETGERCDSHKPQPVEHSAFLLLDAAFDKLCLLGLESILAYSAIHAVLGCQNCMILPYLAKVLLNR